MPLPREFYVSLGPVSFLRAGAVWSLDIGRLGLYGIGVPWRGRICLRRIGA